MAAPTRRFCAALLALALAWLGAVPCAANAKSEPCCAAGGGCDAEGAPPCAQLAVAQCCTAPAGSSESWSAPTMPAPPLLAGLPSAPPRAAEGLAAPPSPTYVPSLDAVSLRTVMLRL